jgi:ACS family tartrate transporter-like MFS transporter
VSRTPAITALRKVRTRLVPFLGLLYFAAFIDRVNVGFAAAQMHRDLGFSPSVYGLGAGIFFLGYCLFEIPSNLLLHRLGARRWIGRIMISWAIVAAGMAFIKTATGFYLLRLLLGIAEAGFFPGVLYYLTYWLPAADRARLIGTFMVAIPVSTALSGPLSSSLLALDGALGLAGWQWLFLTETIPSLLLGFITLRFLSDTPAQATWLTADERSWLTDKLASEAAAAFWLPLGAAASGIAFENGKAHLLVVARDAAAAASVGRIMYAIKNGGAVAWGTKLSLGALVGKLEVAVLGVTSQPLAAALRSAVSTSNGVVAEVR